jgi:UDP-N-acetylmuramate dehydrogenase
MSKSVTVQHPYPTMAHLAGALKATLGPAAVRESQSLARYTTLHIGGPADLLLVAESIVALRLAVTQAQEQEIPCVVLGSGSNVLVSDAGVRGLVVINRTGAVAFSEDRVRAESGASFSAVARQCVEQGLAGLEWAIGIPGTVGGAVVGNAGAWGGDVASTLIQATVLQPDGTVAAWPVERFEYSYRSSVLKQETQETVPCLGQRAVVLEAEFALRAGQRQVLEARVEEITARRRASQPAGATCGSVFKNPPGDYAGRLIEAAGLKGQSRGGAEISPIHANFIVNHGGATAANVKALIDLARQSVQTQFGVTLELEIELIGDWSQTSPVQAVNLTGAESKN